MLPHVRVRRAGDGELLYALCKCLLAACGTAGEPHMFVLWSSHTQAADGYTRPNRPLWSHLSCLCVCFLICLCDHVVSLSDVHPSYHRLSIVSAPLWLTCSWDGEDQTEATWGGCKERQGGEAGDRSEVPTLFPCRHSRDQPQANINIKWNLHHHRRL